MPDDDNTGSGKYALETADGRIELDECSLEAAGRPWSVLHAGMILSQEDEQTLLESPGDSHPYGLYLWPASIALAYELALRGADLDGQSLLELGAGTDLPGMVAAHLGARVVQVDRSPSGMALCAWNCARNGVSPHEQRLADWAEWHDDGLYDWIVGSDVLYAERMHPHLERIVERNLAPHGRLLIADPLRQASIGFLDRLQGRGWSAAVGTWKLGTAPTIRSVAVFHITPPADTGRTAGPSAG